MLKVLIKKPRFLILLAVAAHVLFFLPTLGRNSYILNNIFYPYADQILSGAAPYSALNYEYPPGSIPFVVLPALLSNSLHGFRVSWDLTMLFWDLAAVVLIGLLLKDRPRQLLGALLVYSASIFALGSLSLERFDLVPAVLTLAAITLQQLGEQRRRNPITASADWGAALGMAVAVKLWPLAVVPVLLRRERERIWALVWILLPIVLSLAAVWVFFDDGIRSAVSYHTGRGLQVESLAATPFLIAAKLGADISPVFGAGSFNIAGSGVESARTLSLLLLVAGYLVLLAVLLRRQVPRITAATVLVVWSVLVAPVLSPQFLLWFLPLAAAALGLRWQSLLLIAVALLTRVVLENYGEVSVLGADFVWPLVARNLLFVLWFVVLLRFALKTSTPSLEKISR